MVRRRLLLSLLFALLLLVVCNIFLTSNKLKGRLLQSTERFKEAVFSKSFTSIINLQQLSTVSESSRIKQTMNTYMNQDLYKWFERDEISRVIENQLEDSKRNGTKDNPSELKIMHNFSFPQPAFSKSSAVLLQSKWIRELQKYLKTIQTKELSLVTSTAEHMDVLLNWLVAAFVMINPPLKNVLVISMDYQLHNTLTKHNISSLYVHKNMVVRTNASVSRVFSQVLVVRMAVLRLLNHYGYDVINYDCDAVLLKNPIPLFDGYHDFDLIGGFGKGPDDLYQKWGVTLNAGVMIMRSNANVGKLAICSYIG